MQECWEMVYSNLSKHLQREHKNLKWSEYRKLPIVKSRPEANSMKYRYKEVCELCGKSVLLLPHIKRMHHIFSRSEYDKILGEKQTQPVSVGMRAEDKDMPATSTTTNNATAT